MKQFFSALMTRGFRVLADGLSARASRMSRSRLVLWCIVFFLVTGLAQTWILVMGIRGESRLQGKPASGPVLVLQEVPGSVASSDSLVVRLRALRGDAHWDSLLRARPGLADSLRMLERMDSVVWSR